MKVLRKLLITLGILALLAGVAFAIYDFSTGHFLPGHHAEPLRGSE